MCVCVFVLLSFLNVFVCMNSVCVCSVVYVHFCCSTCVHVCVFCVCLICGFVCTFCMLLCVCMCFESCFARV